MKDEIINDLTDDTHATFKPKTGDSEIPINPYSGIQRVLSEDDLNNIAIKKLIISENDRLVKRVTDLEKIESNFHVVDKEKAVLSEKVLKNNSFEILYTSCITIGSALSGISGIFWNDKGYLLLVLGILLMAGGILAKIMKK